MKTSWATFIFLFIFTAAIAQDSVSVAPGPHIKDGPIRKLLLGKNYRKVWKTPVKARVLDLTALQLKPYESGGRLESKSLKMFGPNNRTYVARSVKKDLSKILPERYRKGMAGDLLRDHASANEPYAALVIQSLAKEIGIYHSTPQLYVLPNDESLGEFREEYGGMLVLLEERPSKHWQGDPLYGSAVDIIETEELIKKRFAKNEFSFDERMYLKSRLLDILVGDWSRHDEQYKWAICKTEDGLIARPIPRDRDHALYKHRGVLNKVSGVFFPYPTDFGPRITHIRNLNAMAANMDKLILPAITKEEWMRITKEFLKEISNEDIDEALTCLPQESAAIDGAKLSANLKKRLIDMPLASLKFYQLINEEPFIPSTNKKDEIKVISSKDSVKVLITTKNKDRKKTQWFERTFYYPDTKQITIAALDEEDHIELTGESESKVEIKLYSGTGADKIENKTGEETDNVKAYDTRPRTILRYLTSGLEVEKQKNSYLKPKKKH